MQNTDHTQKAKQGRKARPAVQLTRIRVETLAVVDSVCTAINALRAPTDPQAMRPQVIAEIVAQYSGAYLADRAQQSALRAQDAQIRAQQALQAAQAATGGCATPNQPDAPQEPAEAALPLAQPTAPRCVAPHYFALHGGAAQGEVR